MEFLTKGYYLNLYNTYKLWFNLGIFFAVAIFVLWLSSLVGGFSNLAYIVTFIALIAFVIYAWRIRLWKRGRIWLKKKLKGTYIPDYKKPEMKEKSAFKYYFSLTWYKFVKVPFYISIVLFILWYLRPFYHDSVVDLAHNLSNGIVLANLIVVILSILSIIYIVYKILHKKKNSEEIEYRKLLKFPVILALISVVFTYYTINYGAVNAFSLDYPSFS